MYGDAKIRCNLHLVFDIKSDNINSKYKRGKDTTSKVNNESLSYKFNKILIITFINVPFCAVGKLHKLGVTDTLHKSCRYV